MVIKQTGIISWLCTLCLVLVYNSQLSIPFPIIRMTETWLSDPTTDSIDISGYKFLSSRRIDKSGGGTGLYLQENLEYKMRTDCNYSDPEVIESLFVELDNPFGKNIVVSVVYGPPNLSRFLEVFNEILLNITRGGKTCYVAGDYNLDILHYNDQAETEICRQFIFAPVIPAGY